MRPPLTPRVAALWVYPLKGMRGIALREAELDRFGVRHDRRWMLVDPAGDFLSQRELPALVRVTGALESTQLRLRAPGHPDLLLPLEGGSGDMLRARVWRDEVEVRACGPEADAWSREALGVPCRLVHLPPESVRTMSGRPPGEGPRVTLNDGYPLHLVSRASLEDLNRRLPEPVAVERFRPNLLVEGTEPYAEDGWQRLHTGAVELEVVARCTRCAVVTVDPESAARGTEPLRTLAGYRRGPAGVEFGVYAAHAGTGTLRVGDSLRFV